MIKSITSQGYNIEVGNHFDSSFHDLLTTKYKDSKKIIIVDENTHDHCLEALLTSYDALKEAEVMLVPEGEENKVMEVCFQIWEALSEYQIGRNDLIINLGGGVVTDMGGFIASIYKRGVDFVNFPTSLLAMVDASSGGKTGIDLGPYKNQLGLFSFPQLVVIDPSFLATLPENELLWGKAEMLKHGLIWSKSHWDNIKHKAPADITADDIFDSVSIKNEVVLLDPTEKSDRKKLNFGHTIGHAIEGFFLSENKIPHGLGVAIGIIAEANLSFNLGLISKSELAEIEFVIKEQYPGLPISDEMFESLFSLMGNDKKNDNSQINFTLLTSIGSAEINKTPNTEEITKALNSIVLN